MYWDVNHFSSLFLYIFCAVASSIRTCGIYSLDLMTRGDYVHRLVSTWDVVHLSRICVLFESGPREYPACEMRILSRIRNFSLSGVSLCCLKSSSALLPESFDRYLVMGGAAFILKSLQLMFSGCVLAKWVLLCFASWILFLSDFLV